MKNQIVKLIPKSLAYRLKALYLFSRGLYFSGSKFYCSFCNKSYRKFFEGGFNLPVIEKMQIIGAGRRLNMICPGCGSTDRDRLLHAYLSKQDTAIQSFKAILHIAPEPSLSKWLHKKAEVEGFEYIKGVKYYENFYYQADTHLMDITDIPFESDQFNFVICNHVLEHIEQDQAAMKEIYRVLIPNGKAILQVPWSPLLEMTHENKEFVSEFDRETHFGQFDHVRLYGRDYQSKLEAVGFKVDALHINDLELNDKYLKSIAINPKEVIFVVTKQEL